MGMILNSLFRHNNMTDVETHQQLLTQSNELLSFLLVKKNPALSLKSVLVTLIKILQWGKEDGLSSVLSLRMNKLNVKNWLS